MEEIPEIQLIVSVYGDDFDPTQLTGLLKFEPTRYWFKGDSIANRPEHILRKETAWEFTTGYVKGWDLQEVSASIVTLFDGKADLIKRFAEQYNLDVKVDIVAKLPSNQIPSLFINRKFLKLLFELNAEVDQDLYLISE